MKKKIAKREASHRLESRELPCDEGADGDDVAVGFGVHKVANLPASALVPEKQKQRT